LIEYFKQYKIMEKLYNTPTNEQLFKIANIITSELKDVRKDNITILFELDEKLLRQIDEDYFFRNNKDAKPSEFIPADEVELTISDIKFKFSKKINE